MLPAGYAMLAEPRAIKCPDVVDGATSSMQRRMSYNATQNIAEGVSLSNALLLVKGSDRVGGVGVVSERTGVSGRR